MSEINKRLENKINERIESGNLRQLKNLNLPFDFVSNDYLGLARSSELAQRIKQRYDSLQVSNKNGSTGSRLLTGNSTFIEDIEIKLSQFFNAEATLVFNSGYMANLALISTIATKEDTILYDQLSHVCMKEGAWMSRADARPFRHNDLKDLELKLKQSQGETFILIESIYSMDGDLSRIQEILDLSDYYGANVIVDEAHSTGVIGKNGNGLLNQYQIQDRVFARIYTFGKALGVHGACICGSKLLINYLINYCRPFIYTTSTSLHQLVSIEQSIDMIFDYPELISELNNKIKIFRSAMNDFEKNKYNAFYPGSTTAIQPIIIPGNRRIKKIALNLQEKGFDIRPILSPTVKQGTERLRISLHVHNHDEEIKSMVHLLKLELLN